jgi:hypothetical protein
MVNVHEKKPVLFLTIVLQNDASRNVNTLGL